MEKNNIFEFLNIVLFDIQNVCKNVDKEEIIFFI